MVGKLEARHRQGRDRPGRGPRAAGDARKVAELEENLASRQPFLEMARKVADDFSG